MAIRSALARCDRDGLTEAASVLADWHEDRSEYGLAAACRAAATSYRWPGVQWPQPEQLANLSNHQRDAVANATCMRVGLLTGTPGTGKTYTLAALVNAIVKMWGIAALAVAAPTGKAAVRITQSLAATGSHVRAATIHQLLEIGRNGHDGRGWGFRRNGSRRLDQRFVFVDEASMLDTSLLASLLDACNLGTHILFVGDPHQLPPVGHGSPLRDMIAGRIPRGHLTEVKRNAGGIVSACAAIKDGRDFEVSTVGEKDALNLLHVDASQPDAILDLAARISRRTGDAYNFPGPASPSDYGMVQVIAATNRSSPLSIAAANLHLQAALNPNGARAEGNAFRVSDKIICTRNGFYPDAAVRDREQYIANGEMGVVAGVTSSLTLARFEQPDRVVRIPMTKRKGGDEDGDEGNGINFALGWAITCHRAQGSEWPVVIVLIDDSPAARRVCSREWLYTAISRAGNQCLLLGRLAVAQQMSRRPMLARRKTFLAEMLRSQKEEKA